MSMEIHVVFRGKLPSKAALTRAMKELGFPLTISPSRNSLEQQSGYMPMRLWKRDETGCEFDVFEGVDEHLEGYEREKIDPSFDRCASFRGGGDENEMLATLCACAALAKLVNGAVLEETECKVMPADELIAEAKKLVEAAAPKDQVKQPGTRPSDIRRYLKPLLELRSDLVLRGRKLMAAPMRHLARGALLDRMGSPDHFCFCYFANPLYGDPDRIGLKTNVVGTLAVWAPQFEALLVDRLEDIFARVGNITTFDQIAAPRADDGGSMHDQVVAMILEGGWDHAAAFAERMRRPLMSEDDTDGGYLFRMNALNEERERCGGDIGVLCAAYHAREAQNVKALKLERYWQPSPFPVELPADQRAGMSIELPFTTTPWISRPAGLLAEMPQKPGDIRYAGNLTTRRGSSVLLHPLTPEEAEERQRDKETYVAATRLPDGLLMVMSRLAGDRNDPRPLARLVLERRVWLHGRSHTASVTLNPIDQSDTAVKLFSLEVRDRTSGSDWLCHVTPDRNVKSIHDDRGGTRTYTEYPLTPEEQSLTTYQLPAFGQFQELADYIRTLLRALGYGEIA